MSNARIVLLVIAAALALPSVGRASSGTSPPSARVTDCDRMAAHPEDQQRVAPGVERSGIDLPAALAACERAIAADPTDARQRYQFARLLFYADRSGPAVEEMRRAADGGYAQAQFVFGTFVARGRPNAPTDICIAASYWRKAADGGRQAARIQFVRYALQGRFEGCDAFTGDAQLRSMLDTATSVAKDFYERLLVEDLAAALAARRATTR